MTETRSACGRWRDADLHLRPDDGQTRPQRAAIPQHEERLRELGHTVFNPCDLPKTFTYRKAIAADLRWISEEADALVVLPGWSDSPGSKAEVALADCIDLPIYEAVAAGFFRRHVWVAIVDEPYDAALMEAGDDGS